MIYILLMILSMFAVYNYVRYRLLCTSIKKTDIQLGRIIKQIGENQILKLEEPNKELEKLLVTMNYALESIRKERILYERKEKEFQRQIENISHDLRTPLTSILGYLELMEVDDMEKENQENIRVVKQKAQFLQRLISQFYDLSRLSGNEYELKMESVDIGRIIREAVLNHFQELEIKKLQINIEIPDQPVWIQGNHDALERVVTNLFQNVSRYAKSELRVQVKRKDNFVSISFDNDVENLNGDDVGRLFDRFYSGDGARCQGSTGLGLTIARYFVEKMGGNLSAEIKKQEPDDWLFITMELKNI